MCSNAQPIYPIRKGRNLNLICPEGEDCSKHSVTLARLLWVEWFLPLLAWHRRESLAIAMEQRYPTFGRIWALVHPVPHPRDEPALVDLGAAAPRVVVPLTWEGLDQPGGLGAQDVEQVLVGQRQGVPGDVKSPTGIFHAKGTCAFPTGSVLSR